MGKETENEESVAAIVQSDAASKHALKDERGVRELCYGTIDELRDACVTFHDTELLSVQKGDESTAYRFLRSDLVAEDGRVSDAGASHCDKAVEIHCIVFHVLSGKWTAELSVREYLEKRDISFLGDIRYLLYGLYDEGFLPYEGKGALHEAQALAWGGEGETGRAGHESKGRMGSSSLCGDREELG